MAIRMPKSCFSFCVSPRIELVVWACICVSLPALMLCLMLFAISLAGALSGGEYWMSTWELIFILVLVIEVVYNVLIIVANLGKNVKLLKISGYLGAALWLTLTTVGIVFFATALTHVAGIPRSTLDELKGSLAMFIIQILIRGYMLLIMRNVMLNLQGENQGMHGYIDLAKTTEMGTNYGQPTQRIV